MGITAISRFETTHDVACWCVLICWGSQVVLQLRRWHEAGYVWGEMAVLFRAKRLVSTV